MAIPEALAKNVEWIHKYRDISGKVKLSAGVIQKIELVLSEMLNAGLNLTIGTSSCDHRLGLDPGTSLTIFRHLLASRRWRIDMKKSLNFEGPISLLPPGPAEDL